MNRCKSLIPLLLAIFIWTGFPSLAYSQTSSPTPESPTMRVPFTVRNSFFKTTGIEWTMATEEERANYLKNMREIERARQKKKRELDRYYRNKKRAMQKKMQAKQKAINEYQRSILKAKRDEEKKRRDLRR